jgi:hypothetical protein
MRPFEGVPRVLNQEAPGLFICSGTGTRIAKTNSSIESGSNAPLIQKNPLSVFPPTKGSTMNNDQLRRDFEAAKRGVLPHIHNRIPMRPAVAESFDDAKPMPSIETIKDISKWADLVIDSMNQLRELKTKNQPAANKRQATWNPFLKDPHQLPPISAASNGIDMPKLTKAFDRINMVADKAFLAHCSCHGDVCNCSYDGQHLFTANNKGTEMTLDKIKFSDIKAVTSELTIAEKQQLLESLTKDVQAAAAKEDGPKRRLAAIKAAAASTDPRMKDAYATATRGLERLGFSLDAIAASGSFADIETKMRGHKWDALRRTGLKTALARIGCIAWSNPCSVGYAL